MLNNSNSIHRFLMPRAGTCNTAIGVDEGKGLMIIWSLGHD
jgi:hypothetical protein